MQEEERVINSQTGHEHEPEKTYRTMDSVVAAVYSDPITHLEMVLVTVQMPSGIDMESVRVHIDEEGLNACIQFEWSNLIANPEALFAKRLNSNDQAVSRRATTIVNALQERLKSCRSHMDDLPCTSLFIKLPKKVRTETQHVETYGIKKKDTMILCVEFQVVQDQYTQVKKRGIKVFEEADD